MATGVIFRSRRTLPEKVEVESSRGVETKLSHLLLQSGHHVHDDNCSFNGAEVFPGTFINGDCFKEAIKPRCVCSESPKKHILLQIKLLTSCDICHVCSLFGSVGGAYRPQTSGASPTSAVCAVDTDAGRTSPQSASSLSVHQKSTCPAATRLSNVFQSHKVGHIDRTVNNRPSNHSPAALEAYEVI